MNKNYKFNFRVDQCVLIMRAMDYLVEQANKRIGHGQFNEFDQLTSRSVKQCALEIRNQIADVVGDITEIEES